VRRAKRTRTCVGATLATRAQVDWVVGCVTRASPAVPPLLFRQLLDLESSTFTYVLADAHSKRAIIIDPVDTCATRDAEIVKEMGLVLQ
jgi:hypothetical protein